MKPNKSITTLRIEKTNPIGNLIGRYPCLLILWVLTMIPLAGVTAFANSGLHCADAITNNGLISASVVEHNYYAETIEPFHLTEQQGSEPAEQQSGGDNIKLPSAISSITFSQLDWYVNDSIHTLNSSWGRIDITVKPGTDFWYVNIIAEAGNEQIWIVQNYPIFPEEYGLPNEQVINFDINKLGHAEGESLDEINTLITSDLKPLEIIPEGEFLLYEVGTLIRSAWGHTVLLPKSVGAPWGHIAFGEVANATKHRNVPAVQEAHNNCITGSYARSLKWLDNEYDLENVPNTKSAQDIYDDLVGLGVGNGTGSGISEEAMLEAKAEYFEGLDGRAVTKFVDLTGWMSEDVEGCTEEKPESLKDWLEEELETEDVEMCYNGHCVTITGIYEQGGKTFLEYRDDERQGNPDEGDTAEKEGELTQVAGGGWNFKGAQVDYVVSESLEEEEEFNWLWPFIIAIIIIVIVIIIWGLKRKWFSRVKKEDKIN